MKKIIRKLKGKKVLSFVLAAIMLATTFNIALPMLKLDASAAGSITTDSGETISQTRIVGVDGSYETTYENYATQYLNGASKPTNIVIPGLDPSQDYVVQGITYYPEKDWMLVTAYHNAADGETVQSSKVFALDAATGEFVAMFDFYNPGTTTLNTEHGGGIAISEHNIYYSCGDNDREIAYAPLSELELNPEQKYKTIQLVASADFVEIGSITSNNKTAYTAYVCYDEGILWTGNFYDPGANLIGINIAATDYNASSNSSYRSMVFGYRLKGDTSEEEWANLIGAKSTEDCKGNPSYAIGLSNAIKDIQYAVVDNGKLYLSRSFGSGAGNSVRFGFGETSILTVADIDLSQPGTVPVRISTKSTDSLDKDIMVHEIKDFKNYDMMPMSEGLCFIDDQLFITFEGASNKYLKESSGLTAIGNCEKPVDVIWQLDPYDLMELEKTAQEDSMYYERVNSLNDIENGEEYIILFESVETDPVTQNNILYAFNANGNFRGHKLSKGNTSASVGYDGMIGHKITEYSIETDDSGVERLYLVNPEKDDVESVRWTINNVNGDNYRIKSTDAYFADYKNFYVSEDKITMAPDNADYLYNLYIQQLDGENGYFYISKKGENFLWCNDGTNSGWMTKINDYYARNSNYHGITEDAGTFHCNATSAPVLGNDTVPEKKEDYPDIYYPDGAFQIYHRKVNSVSSTYESRVYSNIDTKLESDGTYTVTLDTYAISPNHYQYVGEKPTDYIIVADTSYSMSRGGSTGLKRYDSALNLNSLTLSSHTADEQPAGVIGYNFYNPDSDIRYRHEDGKYYKLYVAINNVKSGDKITIQYYFVYFIADDGKYHCFIAQESSPSKTYTEQEFKNWVANPDGVNGWPLQTASGSDRDNADRQKERIFTGEHYRYDNINNSGSSEHVILDALKITAQDLVDKIVEQNGNNRIALVQYGASNGYYNTSGSLVSSGYTDAFWSANNTSAATLKNKISGFGTATEGENGSANMMDCVSNIISNSGATYKSDANKDKDRNVAVILLSDGVPGQETVGTETSGCSTVEVTYDPTVAAATNAANAVIGKAKNIKEGGAFIYTVLLGKNSCKDGTFSKKKYMDAVSSKYPAATTMDDLGGQSVDGVSYALDFATCSYDVFFNFGSIACKEIAVNNGVGLDNLDVNSYLRAVLDDALTIPEDYILKAQFVPGKYDEIGRFSFGKPVDTNAVVPHLDRETKTLTVNGYDYSTQYISKGKENGNALRIVIKGLLANEDVEVNLENAPVSVDGKTGIYKNETKMKADVAFRNFSTERINIPKYTYVLDYGLQMLDTDVNGTLKAVSTGLTKQDVNNYNRISENELVAIQAGDQNLLYSANPELAKDSGYVLIQRDDGTYDWFEIEVVPASNVYFEEDDIDVKEADKANNNKLAWTTEKIDAENTSHRELPDDDDVDGFDNAYNVSSTYSNGTAMKVVVDSTNKNSKNQTFDFVGTGIDIVSRCDKTTGMMLITIKNAETGARVKSAIVDTYCEAGEFNQTPIFSFSGAYDKYTVEIGAMYLSTAGALNAKSKAVNKSNLIDTGLEMNASTEFNTGVLQTMLDEAGVEDVKAEDVELTWFDDNSIFNGGTGVAPAKKGSRADGGATVALENYIDGFRVYNPLGTDSSAYKDTEKNASYVNVASNLSEICSSGSTFGNIAYITGGLADNEVLDFTKYQSIGPKDELYLKQSQSISFNINRNENEKVMLGLRAVNGKTTVTVNNYSFEVKSSTEMYYDISNCINGNGTVNVTVTNGADGLLAVNHIKFSGGTSQNTTVNNGARSMARSGDASSVTTNKFLPITQDDLVAIEASMKAEPIPAMVKNGVVVPIVEEEQEIPGGNTTPDVPEDDNTNDDTTPDNGEKEEFSLMSLIEMLLAFIEDILRNAFGLNNLI